MRSLFVLALVLFSGVSAAQNVTESFSYPNGTKIPNWSPEVGTWKVAGGKLVFTGGSRSGYISTSLVGKVSDFVIDIEVVYPKTKKLYFGGVAALMLGSRRTSGMLVSEVQDSSAGGTGAFNFAFFRELSGGSTSRSISPATKHAVVRLFKKGRQAWFEIDTDMNGSFDLQLPRQSLSAKTNVSGLVGASGYNDVELDNWKLYEGMLLPDKTTSPKIGTTYKMDFTAPLNGGAAKLPTPWFGMMALGNSGIPIGAGRVIPLSLDILFVNSLGFGWTGLLLRTKPSATLALRIPNDKGLVGLKLYAAALTLGSSRPGGFGGISNPHQFVVQ